MFYVQFIAKIYIFVGRRKKIKNIYSYVREIHKSDLDPSILKLYATYGQAAGNFIPLFNAMTGIIMMTYPLLLYPFTNELLLPYGFVIPGTSLKTFTGYSINWIFRLIETYILIKVLNFCDMTYVVLVFNLYPFFAVKEKLLKEIDELIVHKHVELQLGRNQILIEREIYKKLKDFIKAHTSAIK